MEKVSRRRFLKIISAGSLGLIGLGLLNTGCQSLPPVETISEKADYPQIDKERIKDIVQLLSDSKFEGRRAGTPGEAEAGLYLAQELQKLQLVPMGEKNTFFQAFPLPRVELRNPGERAEFASLNGQHLTGDNILGALISSRRPDEFIILSAHYDHLGIWQNRLFPGANDNCSGVSALLEIARALQDSEDLPYSLLFAFWSGEEMGLIGSNYFTHHPTVDLAKVKLNINLDSIGTGDNNDFLLWAAGPKEVTNRVISHWSRQWEGSSLELQTQTTNSSDHRSLGNVQIPALTILAKGWLEGNHTHLDTAINLNYEKIIFLAQRILDFLEDQGLEELLN